VRIAIGLVFIVLGSVGIFLIVSNNQSETVAVEFIEERSDHSSEVVHGTVPDSYANSSIGSRLGDRPPRLLVENEGSDQLFADMSDSQLSLPEVEAFLAKRHIHAYRIVSANSEQLRSTIREYPAVVSFDIQLLGSELVTLVASAATEHNEGWQSGYATWIGGVDGDEASSATLFVAPDGSVNGQVRTINDGRVKIENIPGTSAHLIWQRTPGYGKAPD